MNKNDIRQLNLARTFASYGMRDAAANTIAIVHRAARNRVTQSAALALIQELNLADRVTMVNGCLVTN